MLLCSNSVIVRSFAFSLTHAEFSLLRAKQLDNDPEAPDVALAIVVQPIVDLGSNVTLSAYVQGEICAASNASDLIHVLSESEIAYLKYSFTSENHVARFEIAMIDTFIMSLRQAQSELMNYLQDFCLWDYEILVWPEVAIEEITASAKFLLDPDVTF